MFEVEFEGYDFLTFMISPATLKFAFLNIWHIYMTLSCFVYAKKSILKILNFCKEIEGLEA